MSDKCNKIAIFTTDLYQGGVAQSTDKMVRSLNSHAEVDLIVYDNVPINIKTKAKRTIHLNLPLAANFSETKAGFYFKKIFRLPCMVLAILYMVYYRIKYKPDVIYSMMYVPNIVNIVSSRIFKTKTKIVISERQDPRMDLDSNSLVSRALQRLYPLADRIHANSYPMIDAIKEFYNVNDDKIFHLDNFFFFDKIVSLSNQKIEHEKIFDKKVLITSGRLSKQKGQWHLIYLMSLLNKEQYNLVILGEGELEEHLRTLAVNLNVENNVFFLGNVENPHAYVSKSHAFLFPSIWESFGNSLVEAMALGVPVLSTSCKSGPDFIIDNGKHGVDLGVLPSFEMEVNLSQIQMIKSEIINLSNENHYQLQSDKSLLRAKEFSFEKNKKNILELFYLQLQQLTN